MDLSSTVTAFGNTELAFRGMDNRRLWRARLLFKILKRKGWVTIGKRLTLWAIQLRLPVSWILKPLVFNHFCGGESIEEVSLITKALYRSSVLSIPDFSAEGKGTEEAFDLVAAEVIKTIELAVTEPSVSFAVFKPTGMAGIPLWEKLSKEEVLTEEEEHERVALDRRLEDVFGLAHKRGVPVFVDAEESWIQPAIDRYVQVFSAKYNRSRVIVYNTVQMYRRDRLAFIREEFLRADAEGYLLGYKVVRGAYHEQEQSKAIESGTLSPVFELKADTDHAFDEAIRFCVDHNDRLSLCCATHNEESTLKLIKLIYEKNPPRREEIVFAQLYGMSDHLTYPLAKEGFKVAKYLPYGPLTQVIPYLFRRADENGSVEGQTGRELYFIEKEIGRRRSKGRQG